jgi:zinc protease
LLGALALPVLAVPQAFEDSELPNGVRVWTAEDTPGTDVAVVAQVAAGTESDPTLRWGLAQLAAEMMQFSAANDTAPQSADIRGAVRCEASWNAVQLRIVVAPARLEDALSLLARQVRRPKFDSAQFAALRAKSIENKRAQLNSPLFFADALARRMLWGGAPPGHVTSMASLERISFADAKAFLGYYAVERRTTLIVSCGIERAEVLRLARKHFGDWRAPRKKPLLDEIELPPPEMAPHTVIVDNPGSPEFAIAAVARAPGARDPLRIVAEVLSAWFEIDESSLEGVLCFRQSGPCTLQSRVDSYSPIDRYDPQGAFFLVAVTPPVDTEWTARTLRDGLADRIITPLTTRDLARAKDLSKSRLAESLSNSEGVARTIANELSLGRRPQEILAKADQIDSVSAEQIQALAKQYFSSEELNTVAVGSHPDHRETPDMWVITKDELSFDGMNLRRREPR